MTRPGGMSKKLVGFMALRDIMENKTLRHWAIVDFPVVNRDSRPKKKVVSSICVLTPSLPARAMISGTRGVSMNP